MRSSFLSVLMVTAALAAAAPPAGLAQGDLDAFMRVVLEKRDENWKKIQQYILDEREKIQVLGPSGLPVWGQKREYQWFIREGYFVRSPTVADGVTVPEEDRRKYEDNYFNRVRIRDLREKERRAAAANSEPNAAPLEGGGLDSLLSQTRQPQFIDSAYFLKFKFDQGTYALAGREKFEGLDVFRIEYYPTRLFADADERQRERGGRNADVGQTIERLMNKNALVTIWVEPASKQIVRYTFDNVQLDFFPAAFLFRLEDLKASMTMGQPFKDVWLPRDIEFMFSAMLAFGVIDIKYDIEYFDYREAKTSSRIKGGGSR